MKSKQNVHGRKAWEPQKTRMVWLAERKKAYLHIMYMNYLACKFDMTERKFEAILTNTDLLIIVVASCIGGMR
jgi:hypothetical protein